MLQTTNQPQNTPLPERQSANTSPRLESLRGLRPNGASSNSSAEHRATRYKLQNEARRLFIQHHEHNRTGKVERTAGCCRGVVPGHEHVEIRHNPGTGRASYGNLMVCGSVWGCPVCAARVTEERRQELTEAINKWGRDRVYLVTLTMSHNHGERLIDLLDALYGNSKKKQSGAFRRLKSGRAWQGFCEYYRIVGTIRASETTYGENGWHPHIHMVLVGDGLPWADEVLLEMQVNLSRMWSDALAKEGRTATHEHGCRVTRGVAEYVTKQWAVEHELTKQPVKKGRNGGLSPMELLQSSMDGQHKAGELWIEYYFAHKGRSQLVWSRGLKALLGIGQKSDQEIAESDDPEADVVATLTKSQWYEVVKRRIRSDVLDVVESGHLYALREYLRRQGIPDVGLAIRKHPPPEV